MSYPPIFGPRLWMQGHFTCRRIDAMMKLRHKMAVARQDHKEYDRKIESLYHYVQSFPDHIPCNMCAQHFVAYMIAFPLPSIEVDLETGEPEGTAFTHWMVDAHNAVNVRTGKLTVSYQQADEFHHRDWLDPTSNKQAAIGQAQRLQDQKRIQELETELRQVCGDDKGATSITNIALLITILIVSVIGIIIIVWLLRRKVAQMATP